MAISGNYQDTRIANAGAALNHFPAIREKVGKKGIFRTEN
jgi:hypothetical protein